MTVTADTFDNLVHTCSTPGVILTVSVRISANTPPTAVIDLIGTAMNGAPNAAAAAAAAANCVAKQSSLELGSKSFCQSATL